MPDTDPRRDLNFMRGLVVELPHNEIAARYIGTIVRARDTHGQREPAGTGCKLARRTGCRPPLPHDFQARHRLERAQEYTSGLSGRLSNQVQAVIHSIDEVDIGMTGRSEDHARAIGYAASRVRGKVVASKVGFGLDDPAGSPAVHQNFPEQIARDLNGRALVKTSSKNSTACSERCKVHC